MQVSKRPMVSSLPRLGVLADAVVKLARAESAIAFHARTYRETGKLARGGRQCRVLQRRRDCIVDDRVRHAPDRPTDEQIDRERDRVRLTELFRPNLSAKCSGDAPPAVATRERCGRVPNRRPRGHGRYNGVHRAQRSVWRVEQRSWKFDSSCQRDPPTPICLPPKTAHRSFAHAA